MRTPSGPAGVSWPERWGPDDVPEVRDRVWRNETLGVFVPMEKERRQLMEWGWRTLDGLVHCVYRREKTPYAVTQVDYVLGCGLELPVHAVAKKFRVNATVTCVRCTVAEINQPVIPGE